MATRALDEERLHPFLWRRRRGATLIELPSIGNMLRETLTLAGRLVPLRSAALYLDDPKQRLEQGAPLTLIAGLGAAQRRVGEQMRTSSEPFLRKAYADGKTATRRSGDAHVLAAPIWLEHAVCGVLVVERTDGGALSKNERAIIELIARYIARAILNAVDILKQNALALQDDLTGVKSVRGLDPMLRKEIARAQQRGTDVAVLFIDVDRLKHINDVLGHHAGSEALSRMGRAMRETLEARGTTFRFGGDEFVVVCPGLDLREGVALADRLREAVRAATPGPIDDGQELPAISISVGVASLRLIFDAAESPEALSKRLVRAADQALYRAKQTRDVAVAATKNDDPKFARRGRGANPSTARGKKR